ncbi:AAA family ATPase [Patescibacteria group bacterium]|nr:AAA family ATPase [Patescibacteria group bacterium]MBU4512273.1 AAA family ATPase [Patescibacteria group bacterium]MCG2693273.1 AAA family ATPase [Candidatus Parcubacteria bacterium]
MANIISIVNQKGGVGKTTTAINLAAYLAQAGRRILVVDIDPQANATSGLGIKHQELANGLYEALAGQVGFRKIIINTKQDFLKVAPATISLAGANIELVNVENREFLLEELVRSVQDEYDYIFIDCPPSLALLTVNGLVAADEILIPVQSEYYALEGLGQLLYTINLVQSNLKPNLGILGAVITMYTRKNRLSQEVLRELYQYFPNKIFRTIIPRDTVLAEAPSYGQTIIEYAPYSKGARSYERLAGELLEMEK